MSSTNPRKRARSDLITSDASTREDPHPTVGAEFVKGIRGVAKRRSGSVSTSVSMPFTYSKTDKEFSLELRALFYTKPHQPEDEKAWMQGWMQMGGGTTYEEVVPDSIDISRVTAETRVIKKVAMGADYAPKTMSFPEITRKTAMPKKTKNWGRPAIQSYVEEITGRTALNLKEVGSGMRATLLASKLRLKNSGKDSEAGFRDRMSTSFPQLLTKESTPVGGAAHFSKLIDQELTATPKITTTQDALRDKVVQAHDEANKEIRNRFNYKWTEIENKRMKIADAGKWWVETFGKGKAGRVKLSASKPDDYREEYVSRKLVRHDIADFRDEKTS